METKEISDFVVKKVKVPELPSIENIAGGRMFPQLYLNCFISASKKRGKSTVLSSIILNSINKKTNVIFFVPTSQKDFTYQHIFDKLDKREINYTVYQDIIEDGVNILDKLIDGLLVADPEVKRKSKNTAGSGRSKVDPPPVYNLFEDENKLEEVKERATKKKAPKYIIVIDDMSNATRDPSIARLLKVHRHLKSSVFISSQNCNDIVPAAWRQLDYLLIFGGFSTNLPKLEDIHRNMDLPIDFDKFVQIYRDATSEPYNFLWCDKNGTFRKNFNKEYVL
jgi:hypothetical protein